MSKVVNQVNTNLEDVNYTAIASGVFTTTSNSTQKNRSATDAVFRSVNNTTASLGGRGDAPSNYATSVNIGMRRMNSSITERVVGGEATVGSPDSQPSGSLSEENFNSDNSTFSVSQSTHQQKLNDSKMQMIQNKMMMDNANKAQSKMLEAQAKMHKLQIQATQSLLQEAVKGNQFRLTVQTQYYTQSIEYKKSMLSEMQNISKLLKIGFNIKEDGQKDDRQERESYARMLFGGDWKKGLKGGLMSMINNATAGSGFDLSSLELVKDVLAGALGGVKKDGMFKTGLKAAGKMGAKHLLGGQGATILSTLLSDPASIVESFATKSQFSDNPLLKMLGEAFGIGKKKTEANFDPLEAFKKKHEANKGASFDSTAHVALTKIIPFQLGKLVAAATKQEELHYNYATQRFEKLSETKKNLTDNSNDALKKFRGNVNSKIDDSLIAMDTYLADALPKELKMFVKDPTTRARFVEYIGMYLQALARNGLSLKEMHASGSIRPEHVVNIFPKEAKKKIMSSKTGQAMMIGVAEFLNKMAQIEDREIKDIYQDLLSTTEDYKDEIKKASSIINSHAENSIGALGIFGGHYSSDAGDSPDPDTGGSKNSSGRRRPKKRGSTAKGGAVHSYTDMIKAATGGGKTLSDTDVFLTEMNSLFDQGIEFSEDEMKELALYCYGQQVVPLSIKTIDASITDTKDRMAILKSKGEDGGWVYKQLEKLLEEKVKRREQLSKKLGHDKDMQDAMDNFNYDKFVDNNWKTNKFGGAKLGIDEVTDPKKVSEFANTFLGSKNGQAVSKGVQGATVFGVSTLIAKKAGVGPIMAPILGAITAGAMHMNGTLNGAINVMGTTLGDEQVDDGSGRTKREVLMQNLANSLLPAGFATVTGIKTSEFLKNNLRFGGILGPIVGFGVGSAVYAISKMGFVKKLIGGLFKPISFIGKGLDKLLFKGAIEKMLAPIGDTVRAAGNKYLGWDKKKYKTKDLVKGAKTREDLNSKQEEIKERGEEKYRLEKEISDIRRAISLLPEGSKKRAKLEKELASKEKLLKSKYSDVKSVNPNPNPEEDLKEEANDDKVEEEVTLAKNKLKSVRDLTSLSAAKFIAAHKKYYQDGDTQVKKAFDSALKAFRRDGKINVKNDGSLEDVSGGAAPSKITGYSAGSCAPSVMSRLMKFFFGLESKKEDFYEKAKEYLSDDKYGIKMTYFTDILKTMNKFTVTDYKGGELKAFDMLKNKNTVVIAHMGISHGHFLLYHTATRGDRVMCFDPLLNKDIEVSMAGALISSDRILVVTMTKGLADVKKEDMKKSVEGGNLLSPSDDGSKNPFSKLRDLFPNSKKRKGLGGSRGGKKENAIDVNVVGGHLDAVGVIGAVDAEAYNQKMQFLQRETPSELGQSVFNKAKNFFKRSNEARREMKDQDRQEEIEQQNAENLEKLANKDNGDGKEKKKGIWDKIKDWLPLIGTGFLALFKLGPRGIITKVIEGVIKGVSKVFKGFNAMKNTLDKVASFFGIGTKKAGEAVADSADDVAGIATKGGTEVAQEAVEGGVKGAAKGAAGEAATKGMGALLEKFIAKLSKVTGEIASKVEKLPVVGKWCKKIGASKYVAKLMEKLPGLAKKGLAEAGETVAEKTASGTVKGTLSNFVGIGTLVNIGIAAYDIYSALKDAPKTFGLKNEQLTWKHKLAAGLTAGVLSLIEAIIPGVGWVMIPLRIVFEGFLIREVYSWIADEQDKERDAENKLTGGSDYESVDGKVKDEEDGKKKSKGQKSDNLATDNRTDAAKAEMGKMMSELGLTSSIFGGKFGGFVENGADGKLTSVGDKIEAAQKAAEEAKSQASATGGQGYGGRGYGSTSGSSNKRARFYSQNSYMKNVPVAGGVMQDVGCALAVAKMVTTFLGQKVDDSTLLNASKKYVLGNKSISAEFFTSYLGGRSTKSRNDVDNTLNTKGSAVVVLVSMGQSNHFVVFVNDGGTILLGDPEQGDWQKADLRHPWLSRGLAYICFGRSIITNMQTNLAGLGGRGGFIEDTWKGVVNTGKNLVKGALKTIGFGTSDSSSSSGSSSNIGINGKQESSSLAKASGTRNYEGSMYEYDPGQETINMGGTTSAENSGATGSFVGNTPWEKIMSVISNGEHSLPNYKDPKSIGGAVKDNKGSAYGIMGINTAVGSMKEFIKGGWMAKTGMPLSDNPNFYDNPQMRDKWNELAAKDPNKFLALEMDFFQNKYLKSKLPKPNDIAGSMAKTTGINPTLAKDLGLQALWIDQMVQGGPGGGNSRIVDAGIAKATSVDDAGNRMLSAAKFYNQYGVDRYNKRVQAWNTLKGQPGGAPILSKLSNNALKFNAKKVASVSSDWSEGEACGPSLAMILHSVYYPAKDLSSRIKDFLTVADYYREFGTNYTKNEFFTAFGGKIQGNMNGKELMSLLSENGASAVLNNSRHFTAVIKLNDGFYLIDPTSENGRGEIVKITGSHAIFNESVFVASIYTPDVFKDIDVVLKTLDIQEIKRQKDYTGAAGAKSSLGPAGQIIGESIGAGVDVAAKKIGFKKKKPADTKTYVKAKKGATKAEVSASVKQAMKDVLAPDGKTPIDPILTGALVGGPTPWMDVAQKYMGTKEGDANHKKICSAAGINESQHWCGAFVCAMLKEGGVDTGTWASSQEPASSVNFVKLNEPTYGAIVVFAKVGSTGDIGAQGHAGFYAGISPKGMKLLGGNQGKGVNEVTIWERPIERPGKDKLVGYFYPKNAPGGSTSLTSGAAGSTGRIGEKLTAKNGSIVGFHDKDGNFVDITEAQMKYHRKKAEMTGAYRPPVVATGTGDTGEGEVVNGNAQQGSIGSEGVKDVKSGLPVINAPNKAPTGVIKKMCDAYNTKLSGLGYAPAQTTQSRHLCATGVSAAIAAGLGKGRKNGHAHTYQGAKVTSCNYSGQKDMDNKSWMEQNGFRMISVNSTPNYGDILVYAKQSDLSHTGHITQFTPAGWMSDFRQPDWFVYRRAGSPLPKVATMWRYFGSSATSMGGDTTPRKKGTVKATVKANTSKTGQGKSRKNYHNNSAIKTVKKAAAVNTSGTYDDYYKKRAEAESKLQQRRRGFMGMTDGDFTSIDNNSIKELLKEMRKNNQLAESQLKAQMNNNELAEKQVKAQADTIKVLDSKDMGNVVNVFEDKHNPKTQKEAMDQYDKYLSDFANLQGTFDKWKAEKTTITTATSS